MAFSMTGYGRCLLENPIGRQQWEIRSANGRFLDIKWRLPRLIKPMEYQLEKIARRHMGRGRIEITLELSLEDKYLPKPRLDESTANAMLEAIFRFAKQRNEEFTPDFSRFLQMQDLWSEQENSQSPMVLKYLSDGLAMALADWNQSRDAEGASLVSDLLGRVNKLKDWVDVILKKAPEIIGIKIDRLKKRLQELELDKEIDIARVSQELVILGDKLDITEELTRLDVHIGRLKELLEESGPDLGKRVDFTLQECFREINTCGNKIQDAGVSKIVVDFKNELERCREQAMNLE